MNITIGNFSIMYITDKVNNTQVELESKTNVAIPISYVIIGYNHYIQLGLRLVTSAHFCILVI